MRKKPHRPEVRTDPPCAELRDDDGLPPSIWAKRDRTVHRNINYHGEQLCKQVRIALAEAILCDCADPSFDDLQIIDVRMMSGASLLEVIVGVPAQDPILLSGIGERLKGAERACCAQRLRTRSAASASRASGSGSSLRRAS